MFTKIRTRIRRHRARVAQERALLTYTSECYAREVGR